MVLAPCSSSLPKLLLKPGRWTVGSAATCSYRVTGHGIRPRHALVLCGGQTTVLKAWDSHTWLNGHPVSGEVRLQPGDHVTLGSVEFAIEDEDAIDIAAMLPDLPQAAVQHDAPTSGSDLNLSNQSLTRRANFEIASSPNSDTRPEGWDLDRLRNQIQELRDELSQRVMQRGGATAVVSTPITPRQEGDDPASARVTELEQSAAEARRLAEQAQRELAELRHELDQQRAETVQREQAWEQQAAAWSAERDRWQEESVSLADARQQLAAEAERRQSAALEEALRWKSECEQLRTAWQLQQAAWENERSHWQDDLRRQEEAAQQSLQAATQREQELLEQSQRLLAEREQIEAERQQFQTEEAERTQARTATAEERQQIEQRAAEVLAQVEDLSRRTSEFEQQKANFAREQQTLEHSWNWLQSDRRKLVEEKEEWQLQRAHWQAERERWVIESEQLLRDREDFAKARELWHEQHAVAEQLSIESEQLAAQRQQLQAEQSAWAAQREQYEIEHQVAVHELEAARAELRSEQQTIREEYERLQTLRSELEAHTAEFGCEHRSPMVDFPATPDDSANRDDEMSSWADSNSSPTDSDWNNDAESSPEPKSPHAWPTDMSLSPLTTLTDAWSVGVDLTAPRESYAADRNVRPEITSEGTPPIADPLIDDSPSLTELEPGETTSAVQPANDWGVVATPPTPLDTNLAPSQDLETPLDNTGNESHDAEAEAIPSNGPVVSILESMAFAEDEDVDESVSRYMQHLLARSPLDREGERDRYIPVSALKKSSSDAVAEKKPFSKTATVDVRTPSEPAATSDRSASLAQTSESLTPADAVPPRPQPAHLQDREAIRAATEQMRQVANQQTVKIVEAANWKRIRRSIKTKLALAALSFVLSAGLLFWGYHYRPEFLILGILTSGLGIVTWLDLLLAIRQAHVRASKLTGRKKPSGPAKS